MIYEYKATITDVDSGDIVAVISAGTQDGLEEEMGKRKWNGAVERYEEHLKAREDEVYGVGDAREESEEALESFPHEPIMNQNL